MSLLRKRRLRSARNHLSDLSMTPIIDVALTLLIMFMVAAPMLQNAIKVTLPRGNAQESTHSNTQELIVYIDSKGDLYWDNRIVNKQELIELIKTAVGNDLDRTVYVRADTAVSYGTVVELVDDIKFVGGVHYVALATQKHAKTTSPMA